MCEMAYPSGSSELVHVVAHQLCVELAGKVEDAALLDPERDRRAHVGLEGVDDRARGEHHRPVDAVVVRAR